MSLDALEQQRSAILMQILELGDLRSGSISAINGRCGKPTCHCHLRKAQREVEAFHLFRQLSQELLEVNEKICRARPVTEALSPEEKKRRKPSARRSRAK